MENLFSVPILAALAINFVGYGASPPSTHETASGTTFLEQTSQAFTRIAEKAMPATVYIKANIIPQHHQEQTTPFDMFSEDFFRRFFGGSQPFNQMQPQQSQVSGSGFLITKDGYIVTNNHVVKDAANITVTLNDGREFSAIVKGADSRTDLAVLKIEGTNLPFLTFGDSDDLKIGEWVVAIGNPFGIGATLTAGVVSAKGRQDLGLASYEDFIQTDAAINPGNSGGPLFNLQGQVIGVNTAIYTRSGGYMGIGLSIPSKMAQNIINQILETGMIKRAYLGIILQSVDKELATALELENQDGVIVSDVVKGSPAAQAGLQQGDIILQYNENLIKTATKFRNEIAMMSPGSHVKLDILRNNKKVQLIVALGSLEGELISAELIQKLGIEIENLNQETASQLGYNGMAEGVVISRVKSGSPAFAAGLRSGFLITGVVTQANKTQSVKNTSEFEEAMKDIGEKKLIVLVARNQNFQRYYTIKLE